MIELCRGIRRFGEKIERAASRVVRAAIRDTGDERASPPAEKRPATATPRRDAARRQLLALWWILRLTSDAPEREVTERATVWWQQASESSQPFAQQWRHIVKAVEGAVVETTGHAAQPATKSSIVAEDRAAVALILGGHDVAEVAYLEQISVRDVHRRLRTGLTSLGSASHHQRIGQLEGAHVPPVVANDQTHTAPR
jgi:hypothetical protein